MHTPLTICLLLLFLFFIIYIYIYICVYVLLDQFAQKPCQSSTIPRHRDNSDNSPGFCKTLAVLVVSFWQGVCSINMASKTPLTSLHDHREPISPNLEPGSYSKEKKSVNLPQNNCHCRSLFFQKKLETFDTHRSTILNLILGKAPNSGNTSLCMYLSSSLSKGDTLLALSLYQNHTLSLSLSIPL